MSKLGECSPTLEKNVWFCQIDGKIQKVKVEPEPTRIEPFLFPKPSSRSELRWKHGQWEKLTADGWVKKTLD